MLSSVSILSGVALTTGLVATASLDTEKGPNHAAAVERVQQAPTSNNGSMQEAGGGAVDCVCGGIWTVGDEVIRVDDVLGIGGPVIGAHGVVFSGTNLFATEYVLVAWDGFAGHTGNGFDVCPPNPTTAGNGWYVPCEDVEAGVEPVDCVCDGVWNVGDRVVKSSETGSGGPAVGSLGSVVSGTTAAAPVLLVSWDGFAGHDGNGFAECPPATVPDLTGWFVNCDEVSVAPEFCPGDANGDGRVDVEDLLIVLANWGCQIG